MFDFAFSELALIGVVALVVIGPERLPRVARTAGVVVGRLQRYAATVKADIAREVELSELRRVQGEIRSAAQSFESSMRESLASAEAQFQQAQNTVMGGPQPSAASLAAAGGAAPAAGAPGTAAAAVPALPADVAALDAADAIGAPSPYAHPASLPGLYADRAGPIDPENADPAGPPGPASAVPWSEDPFHFPAQPAAARRAGASRASQANLFSADEAPPGDGLPDPNPPTA